MAAQPAPAASPESGPDTVRFTSRVVTPEVPAVPGSQESLAGIDRKLGELVRLGRLALVLWAVWIAWDVFGGGLAWLAGVLAWTGAVLLVAACVGGAVLYFSPTARRRTRRFAGKQVAKIVAAMNSDA